MADTPIIDDLKTPLLAVIGAADLGLATTADLITGLREHAGEATGRVEESRTRLARLREQVPGQLTELWGRLTGEKLRKTAQGYAEATRSRYNELVNRGQEALERLRSQSGPDDSLTLGGIASKARAVGERAAKLVGVERPKANTDQTPAAITPIKKAAAKKPVAAAPTEPQPGG